jgi:hypothetical protein
MSWYAQQTMHRIVKVEAIPHYWQPFCAGDADIDAMVWSLVCIYFLLLELRQLQLLGRRRRNVYRV